LKNKRLILVGALILIGASGLSAKSTLLTILTDMFNQISIKPQEQGSMTDFPIGMVNTMGQEIEDPNDRFSWLMQEMDPITQTKNPFKIVDISIENGEQKFNTYCAVCHGTSTDYNQEGFAKTKVNDLGMIAPPLLLVSPTLTDGYIYKKSQYGGAVMPPLGYATTEKDRWDIVNYIRELEKK
jgi:mono/diheme cytochrome c family protein